MKLASVLTSPYSRIARICAWALLLTCTACRSLVDDAADQLESGQYRTAVATLRTHLSNEPDSKKARKMLSEAEATGCAESVGQAMSEVTALRLHAAETSIAAARFFNHACDPLATVITRVEEEKQTLADKLSSIEESLAKRGHATASSELQDLDDVIVRTEDRGLLAQLEIRCTAVTEAALHEFRAGLEAGTREASASALASAARASSSSTRLSRKVATHRDYASLSEALDRATGAEDWGGALDRLAVGVSLIKDESELRPLFEPKLRTQFDASIARIEIARVAPLKTDRLRCLEQIDHLEGICEVYSQGSFALPDKAPDLTRVRSEQRDALASLLLEEARLAQASRDVSLAATSGILSAVALEFDGSNADASKLQREASVLTALKYSLFASPSDVSADSELDRLVVDSLNHARESLARQRVVILGPAESVEEHLGLDLVQAGFASQFAEELRAQLGSVVQHVAVRVSSTEQTSEADRKNSRTVTARKFDRMVRNPAYDPLQRDVEAARRDQRQCADEEMKFRNAYENAKGVATDAEREREDARSSAARAYSEFQAACQRRSWADGQVAQWGAAWNYWHGVISSNPNAHPQTRQQWQDKYEEAVGWTRHWEQQASSALDDQNAWGAETDRRQTDFDEADRRLQSAQRDFNSADNSHDLTSARLRETNERLSGLDQRLRSTPPEIEQHRDYQFQVFDLRTRVATRVQWELETLTPTSNRASDSLTEQDEESDTWTVGVSPDDRSGNREDPDQLRPVSDLARDVRQRAAARATESIQLALANSVPHPEPLNNFAQWQQPDLEELEHVCAKSLLAADGANPSVDNSIREWLLRTELKPVFAR